MSRTATGVLIAEYEAGMLPASVRSGGSSCSMSPTIKPRNLRKELGMTSRRRVQKRPKASECPFRCRYPKCGRGYTSQKSFRAHNALSPAEKKKKEEKEKKMEEKKSQREESAESDDTVTSKDSGYSSFDNKTK
ncbi:hypothetical protein CJF30_00010449 [Rutstroemia sp. NJR-2017a BBW]|nr:hypothetical protein CJF30_00010449 [Rutstroemia sp. NJR-2017a BBW]